MNLFGVALVRNYQCLNIWRIYMLCWTQAPFCIKYHLLLSGDVPALIDRQLQNTLTRSFQHCSTEQLFHPHNNFGRISPTSFSWVNCMRKIWPNSDAEDKDFWSMNWKLCRRETVSSKQTIWEVAGYVYILSERKWLFDKSIPSHIFSLQHHNYVEPIQRPLQLRKFDHGCI